MQWQVHDRPRPTPQGTHGQHSQFGEESPPGCTGKGPRPARGAGCWKVTRSHMAKDLDTRSQRCMRVHQLAGGGCRWVGQVRGQICSHQRICSAGLRSPPQRMCCDPSALEPTIRRTRQASSHLRSPNSFLSSPGTALLPRMGHSPTLSPQPPALLVFFTALTAILGHTPRCAVCLSPTAARDLLTAGAQHLPLPAHPGRSMAICRGAGGDGWVDGCTDECTGGWLGGRMNE